MLDYLNDFFPGSNLSTLSIPGVKVSDILDILIVSYFIYKIMMWIKETRAWTLFKGVVIIIVLSGFAIYFNLFTISWIVESIGFNAFLAIMILFQPELRQALERLGRGSITLPFSINDTSDDTKSGERTSIEIIKAAKAMSVVCTGAIIVLEQKVALGDHERTGVKIDAVLTSQLLINIFEKNTPLHDGAVIVRNNRIAAAKCILPLTEDEIGGDLGTRHRAAVGTSQVSDAIVVVVSEETGNISIATGGKLYKGLNESKLNDMLTQSKKEEKKKLTFRKGRQKKNEKNK